MKNASRFRLFPVSVLLAAPLLNGAIEWRETEIVAEASLELGAVTVAFAFENGGTEPITIETIKTTCGCTTADLDTRTFAPGEGDALELHFEFGDRVGLQTKKARVTTSDGITTELVLKVDIPVALSVEPRYLRWKRGEALEEKRAHVELNVAEGIEVASVDLDSDAFIARIEAGLTAGERVLVVRPKSTNTVATAQLLVKADKPVRAPAAVKVYLRVH